MINVKKRELVSAFNKHKALFRSIQAPHLNHTHYLILFYAVECGLKALALQQIKGNSTSDFVGHAILDLSGNKGHNLKIFLRFLGYASFRLHSLKCKNNDYAPVHEYNQVWRYGISVKDKQKEREILIELDTIMKWIEERI